MRNSEQRSSAPGWSASVIALAMLLVVMFSRGEHALAVDPPHNGKNSINVTMSCATCHYDTTGPTPSWATQPTTTDETYYNNLCTSCHQPTSITDSSYIVKTHSYQNTSGKYGVWTVECRTCHNPHTQDQASAYPADPNADLLTGTVGSYFQPPIDATETAIPLIGITLTPNQWIDYVFVPNTTYPTRLYRIKSNTAESVTVIGPVNVRYAAPGSRFAVRYGKMVKAEIGLPSGGAAAVKFFGASGMNSLGTSTDPANMTSLCQVCHAQTTSFNNSGVLEGPGHPALQAGRDCTACHLHTAGFKPECGSCHGSPPLINVLGGPDGLVLNEGGTGPTTPGAHGKHAVSAGYACTTCHSGGMPASPTYDKKLQIGFNIANGAYQNGSYDGRSTLANGYSYTKGNPGTTITNTGTKTCSNVYCHGTTMAPNGGTDITPVWDNPSTAACGTCHGATASNPPTRGSHYIHAQTYLDGYKYACNLCHPDPAVDASLHVNSRSEVVFSSDPKTTGGIYSGTGAMLDAYGACTNVYCHSTVQSSPPGGAPVYRMTLIWGQENYSCGACHDYAPALATGSHGKHMQQPVLQECWACHNYNVIDDGCMACHDADSIQPQRDRHANYRIDVAFAPMYGGAYSGTPAPGDAYGSCSNSYCHSTVQGNPDPLQPPTYVTTTWGQSFSGVCARGACHPVGNAHPSDGGYAPLTSGGHAKHLKYKFDQDGNCQSCHYDASYGGCLNCHTRTAGHADKSIDVIFNPEFPIAAGGASGVYTGDAVPRTAYGSCSALYCHSPGSAGSPPYAAPNVTNFTWGGSVLPSDCTGCHNGDRSTSPVMSTGSHGKHVQSYGIDCYPCHAQTVSSSRTLNTTTYVGNLTLGYRNHSNGWINVAFSSGTASNGTYAGQASPVNMKAPGSAFGACGNTYCHSNGSGGTINSAPGNVLPPTNDPRPIASNTSSTWSTPGPLECGACHGYPPSYAMDRPKANSHINNFHNYVGCNVCHYPTTANGTSITDMANHVNGRYDIQPDPAATYGGTPVSFTYIYDPGGGYCTTVSCHEGWSVSWGYGGIGSASIQVSPTANCNEASLSVFYAPAPGNAGVAPVSYYWTFGDGTAETQDGSPVVHTYAGPGPYNASVRGRDSMYHLYASAITQVWPQQTNSPPVVNETVTVDRYTVTLTDLSTDPDYNVCGHSGNGQIRVTWGTTGYVDTVPDVLLSGVPTNTVISRTFSSPTSMNVAHSVTDNAGLSAGRVVNNVTIPGPISISGTARYSNGTAFAGVTVILKTTGGSTLTLTTTDASGAYTLSRTWVDDCFLVEPFMTGYTFSPATRTVCANTNSADFQAN